MKPERRRCPWPGPVPYREEDADLFMGRDREVFALHSLVERQRLSILIGVSGTGKSSLLQAGLIPVLRRQRENDDRWGPVLLLRDWSLLRELSPAGLIVEGIRRSISNIGNDSPLPSLRPEIQKLAEIPGPSMDLLVSAERSIEALIDYVQRLCATCGTLVLVLDQVEELLGSGLAKPDNVIEGEVLKLFGALFTEERVRLVLALREEYFGRLALLHRYVEGLDRRVFRLRSMTQQEAREIVLAVQDVTAKHVRFESEDFVVSLLTWLGDGSAAEGEETSVDLLRLQALLIGLYRHASSQGSADTVVIGRESLESFKVALGLKLGSSAPLGDLAMRALETYIEQIVQEGERAQHSPGRTLIRRVLVRMAPWLTSPGGFKRHVTGDEIIYNAIRDDLEALRVASLPEAVRVAILMLLEDRKLGRDKDSLLTIVFHGGSSADGASAGEGRDQGWSREKVATVLVDAGAQVLDLLCRVNVLKVARGSAGPTYELVHDGIGPAIVAWAEREYFLFRDTISSIVARRGEVFRWREIGASEVRDAVWLGCNLTEVIARKVTFYNCRFSGSIFTDCDFSACRFIDCDMGGVTFVNGQWNDILWQSCQGRSAIFTSARWLGSVRIEGSILDNAMLVDLELGGHLEFNDSSLQFSQVGEFRFIDGASPRISFSGCDLQNSLLVAKQLSISDDCNENGLLRRPVPPIAPRRGRLSLWAKEGTCATS